MLLWPTAQVGSKAVSHLTASLLLIPSFSILITHRITHIIELVHQFYLYSIRSMVFWCLRAHTHTQVDVSKTTFGNNGTHTANKNYTRYTVAAGKYHLYQFLPKKTASDICGGLEKYWMLCDLHWLPSPVRIKLFVCVRVCLSHTSLGSIRLKLRIVFRGLLLEFSFFLQ